MQNSMPKTRYPVHMPVSKGRKKANKSPTPPSHKPAAIDEQGPSPIWYVSLMFGLMAVGVIVILLNYIGLLPGETSNIPLLIGLTGIGIGFAMTMNYR
ncbi:MAG: hypothetical protein BMS9Abin12_1405 [Acidimicrobiia bacterium]|nr:MAG: hypothetical protein BMS9Abin12_1405 [Acidimicrobiia bacterium]